VSTPDRARMPRQIPFIIANEGCERFSFYGMRNVLTQYLSTTLLLYIVSETERKEAAVEVFHSFVIGVYFFPLIGGWLADRFFGKYSTILWFSLIYCVGQGCLAAFVDNETGFYVGLLLISIGSGGIKPLVASFVGDQFDQRNKHLAQIVFDGFYWIINFGSFFATLLMPIFLKHLPASVTFGIPGALMFIATVVFFVGRKRYVMVPPAPVNPHSFLRVAKTALLAPGRDRVGLIIASAGVVFALSTLALIPVLGLIASLCLGLVMLLVFGGWGTALQLDRARDAHPDEAVDGVRAVLRVLVVFALITPFWSLFDQKASVWVLQANDMVKPEWFAPSHMQALNPLLVMILLPLNNFVVFPALRRRGLEPTPLRKMTVGIASAGLAWIVIGCIQLVMDGGTPMSIWWQVIPFALLTTGEVLVSATGLEFAYSQAPPAMKGSIMSFFNLSITVGNLWVLLANASVKSDMAIHAIGDTGLSVTAFLMFFFAGFALVVAGVFKLYARRYRVVDHYRAT
jgi:POT family proton-dependent oligopeptide transporter